MRPGRPRLALALALTALIGGCGNDGDAEPARRTGTESAERSPLPAGWSREANRSGGLSLALPPLWQGERRGVTLVVRSPDRLLAITASPDRTKAATEHPLADFAEGVAASLRGYRELRTGSPKRVPHRYAAVAIEGTGKAKDGPEQDLLIAVFDREGLVRVTALAAWNAARTPAADVRAARRILRTIRTQPVS